jgi:alpha-glucosidase
MRRVALLLLLLFFAASYGALRTPAYSLDLSGMGSIGDVRKVAKTNSGILIDCLDESQVSLQVLAPDLVRVRTGFKRPIPAKDQSWAIARTIWDAVPINVSESPEAVSIETSELRVVVNRTPLRIQFFDVKTGRLINSDSQPMMYNPANQAVAAVKSLGFEEHFYGLGEKAARLDKRREAFQMWSSDTPGYTSATDPIYQSIPFYIGHLMDRNKSNEWHGSAYGIFFDNSYRTRFDLGSTDPENVVFQADGGEMNYYFFYGPEMKKVVSRFTELTGRMPMPPKWALGHQQSRYSYGNEQQIRDVVERYQAEKIPLDVIHFDIHYMDGYRDFTWNHDRFPDPKGLMTWLAERGVKPVTIIDPGVKYEPGGKYSVYNEGTERNYFLKKTNGETYVGKVWPGDSVFVDYSLPDAAKWWGDLHKPLLDAGVAGIWNDMNEPADFESRDGEKWKDVVNFDNGENSKHNKMRNLFALLECKATYEGLSRLRPNERPYIITRSGYAGIQRYATMWTGDSPSTWSAMELSIPMFQTLGLCGQPFVGSDCGGYQGRCNGELLTRWYQIGFLSPFFRNHHAVDFYDQEPWRFGKKYEDIIRKYVKLRYRIMPYLYTVLAEAHATGLPWIRPLILEYQNDYNVLNIDDEFLVGENLLVAPVVSQGATAREVYLPSGEWYEFGTSKKYPGSQWITVQAPIETVPIFIKAGSILPYGPEVDYIGQLTTTPVSYEVYPDKTGAASGRLYEDDGTSQAYLNGASKNSTLKFSGGRLTSASGSKVEDVPANLVKDFAH